MAFQLEVQTVSTELPRLTVVQTVSRVRSFGTRLRPQVSMHQPAAAGVGMATSINMADPANSTAAIASSLGSPVVGTIARMPRKLSTFVPHARGRKIWEYNPSRLKLSRI